VKELRDKIVSKIGERMKTGLTISAVGHIAILLWAVVTFVTKPLNAQTDSVAVDIISTDQFSKMTAGQKDAKKVETPKPIVEKVAEAKPVEPVKAKITEKKEVVAATEATPPPPSEEKKIEKKEKKPAEAKADPIAEALKKDEAKKPEEKKAEAPPPAPKKPIPVPPKFDPMKIAALLNKQEAQRQAATGSTINNAPSLGVSTGQSATLSQNELDALRARLAQLWNPPAGATNPQELVVVFRIQLKRDGTLAAPPEFVPPGGTSQLFLVARDKAASALFRGQPYNMLRQETYEVWKDIEIKFDPREMFGG
jgi:hypothetical protein